MSKRPRSNAKADIWDTKIKSEDIIRFMLAVERSKDSYTDNYEDDKSTNEATESILNKRRNGKSNIWQEFSKN